MRWSWTDDNQTFPRRRRPQTLGRYEHSETPPNGHLPIADVFLETGTFSLFFNGEPSEKLTLRITDTYVILI